MEATVSTQTPRFQKLAKSPDRISANRGHRWTTALKRESVRPTARRMRRFAPPTARKRRVPCLSFQRNGLTAKCWSSFVSLRVCVATLGPQNTPKAFSTQEWTPRALHIKDGAILGRSSACLELPAPCRFPTAFSFRLDLQPKSASHCHHETRLECSPRVVCGNFGDYRQDPPCAP